MKKTKQVRHQFAVSYELPYTHHVTVGVIARSSAEAIRKADAAFNKGTIWNDTAAMPLLFDDYCEAGDAGIPLEFSAEKVEGPYVVDESVLKIRRDDAARDACRALVAAYRAAETCGASVRWEDVDRAYELALGAVGEKDALAVLKGFDSSVVLADVYDDSPALADALSDLIPGFEYPDWSHRTIGSICKRLAGKNVVGARQLVA